jgi:hypothetical protein
MLNTFRVIFVDQGGYAIDTGGCMYNQTGEEGYYSFDHGQPVFVEGSAVDDITGNYAYDNRSINDWFYKYGIYKPEYFNSSLFPPNNSLATEQLAGSTGSILAGMTTPARTEDDGQIVAPFNNFMKKYYGVTLNLRTPSYFFTENSTKRNISRTKAIDFDSSYDLQFDTNPSNPVQDNEIDLKTTPTDYPKWIYIGVIGAGGPGGAPIQALSSAVGDLGEIIPCTVGDGIGGEGDDAVFGICPFWDYNDEDAGSIGGIPSGAESVITYPGYFNYRGPQSRGQDGARVGVFIRTCALETGSDGTRKTLVVRLADLGRGGVQSYKAGREKEPEPWAESTINRTKTTFPSIDFRKTKVEIYVAEGDDTDLGEENLLLTIQADGGKSQIMSITTAQNSTCAPGERRPYYCQQCRVYQESDDSPTGGGIITRECVYVGPPLYSDEIYHNAAHTPTPVDKQNLVRPNVQVILGDYALENNVGIGPEADIRVEYPQWSNDSTLSGARLFPPSIESLGIRDQSDWFREAGGIQATPETVERDINQQEEYFGLGADFVFHGDTKYILKQNLLENAGDGDPVIFDGITPVLPDWEDILVAPAEIKYFKFDDEIGKYVELKDDAGTSGTARAVYSQLTAPDTTKVKMEITFAPNSYHSFFRLTTVFQPTFGGIDWDFEFRKSTEALLPTPGEGGAMRATMIDANGALSQTDGIGNEDSEYPGEFAEGVGGNGGGVFVGWGININRAVESGSGLPNPDDDDGDDGDDKSNNGPTPWNDFPLQAGDGFGDIMIRPIRGDETAGGSWPEISDDTYYSTSTSLDHWQGVSPPPNSTVYQKARLAYEGDYSPVGDPDAKGYDVAPIARFTELPELTREGDFYVTLQAYHMEGIHKVTFIMDNGDPIDVYRPVPHPDDLGTHYDKSASALGKDYEEYMVKVDTTGMENNSVHEIRAIVWPNSGYPLVLQGEKQDSHRFVPNTSGGGVGDLRPDEEYKITPTIYPWITNKYPEMMGQYNPNQLDVDGNPLTIAPNPETGGITLTDEPAWYRSQDQSNEYLDSINVDRADVLGQYQFGEGADEYVGNQIRTWQAVPGQLVDNFEGHVDDNGEPAWWIDAAETNIVSYHGFWFRYQKSGDARVPSDTNKYPDEGKRRVLYVNVDIDMSARDTDLLGTLDHPYQSLDELMQALDDGTHPEMRSGASPRYELEDYFSAKFILLGQKDSAKQGEPAGRVYKWWGSDNLITKSGNRGFQNTLDHNASRNSAQNPSCQMLTVEARKVDSVTGIPVPPSADDGAPIDFNPDRDALEIYDKEVVLQTWDAGWGREFHPDDPSKDNGGHPANVNIHYKNFRFFTDMPTASTDPMFDVNTNTRKSDDWGDIYQTGQSDYRFKAPTSVIENCKISSWSEWGAVSQLGYVDKSFVSKPNPGGDKVYWAGPMTPAVAGPDDCQGALTSNEPGTCLYDQVDTPPLDRTGLVSIAGNHPVVWEKVGDKMYYIWQGEKFADPEKDIVGVNRQLFDERLPAYGQLIRWTFANEEEVEAQQDAINAGLPPAEYPDGLYVSVLRDGRGPEGISPNDDPIDLTVDTSAVWRPLIPNEEGIPNQRRRTGSLKNDSSFTRKLVIGYSNNIDVYSNNCITVNHGGGRRWVGVNLVKNYVEYSAAGDTAANCTSAIINCIVDTRSINYFTGKRIATNGGNTVHGDLNQIDRTDNGWYDNRIIADILMPNNAAQLGHFSGAEVRRRTSKKDDWRVSHKFRNWAIVNVISDSTLGSASWNIYEVFDHFYIRGNRLRETRLRLAGNDRHGLPLLGERYDNRVSHLYMADQNSGQVGIEISDSGDGIQGAFEVVNTSIADPEYAGYARPRPKDPFVDTEGNEFVGVQKYVFSRDNYGFYPQSVDPANGAFKDAGGRDIRSYVPTPLPANQLYWYPVYDGQELESPGNYVTSLNENTTNSVGTYNQILRGSLAQYCDISNSIVRFDTCTYLEWGSGGGKFTQGNIETNFFNQNGIPPLPVAYNIQSDDVPINTPGLFYSVGAPAGVPTKYDNAFNIVVAENEDPQELTYIPTFAGNSGELETMRHGFTAPLGYNEYGINSPDGMWVGVKEYLESSIDRVADGYPRAGKVVEAYYLYDRNLFKQIVDNGGWNYTPQLNVDYTPHKL